MRVCIHGALGRMGQRLLALAHADSHLDVSAAIERPDHPLQGQPVGTAVGVSDLTVPLGGDVAAGVRAADVVITFALPAASLECIEAAASAGVACVIGTTGFAAAQEDSLARAAERVPLVHAPNFSLGVNMLFKIAEEVAGRIGADFDMEIVELHHNQKVDAPSGTAMRLADGLARAVGRTLDAVGVYGREGQVGKRSKNEIGVLALRGGDVVGEHTVIFAGIGERLELTHRAHSRDNFAKGALVAARWIHGRPAGRYDMFDVLGLR